MKFFAIFFGILYYRSGKNSSEWFFLFFLFLGHAQHILARKEAIIVFSNFLNCFTIFLEFSIMVWVGTPRNDFFYFLFSHFLGLSQLILAWWEAIMVFFNVFNFFFEIFYYGSCRNSSERFFYFLFSLFLGLSQLILAREVAKMVFFIFFAFFLKFSITWHVGTRRNDFFIFYFLSFSAFPNLFWVDEKP